MLNQRLTKLVRYGIIEKTVFAEKLPRVEYALTLFGAGFVAVLDDIAQLHREHTRQTAHGGRPL